MTDQDEPEPSPAQVGAFDAGAIAYAEGRPSTDVPFRNADPDVGDLAHHGTRDRVPAVTRTPL